MGVLFCMMNVNMTKKVILRRLETKKILTFFFQNTAPKLAPVAETGLSHRLTAYKIVGHFYGLSYLKISGIIRSKIFF